ncbi:MAG: hypothetical protein AMXMBFR16_10290 [Candidatus Uhrbacteria bacterium]
MIDPNWARWIFTSVAVNFSNVAANIPITYRVEGIDERNDVDLTGRSYIELRVNGPFIKELSRGYYHLQVDINILVNDLMDEINENAYGIVQWCGILQDAMDRAIPVMKYGSGPSDNPSVLVGCLTPRKGRFESNRVIHFGQINKVDRIRQSMVDGRFEMYLTN